ncbi:MAG: hypothetical protein ACRYFX_08775 [Janthinobacterium lividum]
MTKIKLMVQIPGLVVFDPLVLQHFIERYSIPLPNVLESFINDPVLGNEAISTGCLQHFSLGLSYAHHPCYPAYRSQTMDIIYCCYAVGVVALSFSLAHRRSAAKLASGAVAASGAVPDSPLRGDAPS